VNSEAKDAAAIPGSENAQSSEDSVSVASPASVIKIPGAAEIFESIYEENRVFIMRKHLFDAEYFNFVWSIVNANLPPLPQRTPDEIRREREEAQRKGDVSRMFRERRELERETNSYPSPFVQRIGLPPPNMPPPPGPRQLTAGSGPNAIKLEVRAVNHTPASLKQEEARLARERKQEEARRAKEKPLDADEQRLEQDRKMDAAEKAAKDKKAAAKAERTKSAGSAKKTTGSDATADTSTTSSKKGKKSTKQSGQSTDDTTAGSRSEHKNEASSSSSNAATTGGSSGKKKKSQPSSGSATLAASSDAVTTETETDTESSSTTASSGGVKADLTNFALDFIKNIYVHARETPLLSLWLTTLYRLYAANLNKAKELLKSLIDDPNELARSLLSMTSEKARGCHAQMIVAAMRALSTHEKTGYMRTALLIDRSALGQEPPSYCVWFLEEMWKLSKIARRSHFDGFFYIFAQFAAFGQEERNYLLKRRFLKDFVAFALYFEPSANHTRCNSTPRQAATEMFNLADLLANLLLACDSEAGDEHDQPPTSLNPDRPYELSDEEHPLCLGYLVANLMMREDINSHAYGRIICHFAWENEEMSKFLLDNISRGIYESALPSQSRGFLDVLCYVVKNLDDSLQSKRFDFIIQSFPTWLHCYKIKHRAGSERLIHSFFIMASLHPLLRQKLMAAKSTINSAIESAGYRIL